MESSVLVRDRVFQCLRADIISCRLLPGTELTEKNLAARFEVSKSPVRDALHRLEVERLVSVLPRRGYQITPISVRDAQELRELRSVVEQACARKAAELASDASLIDLDRFRQFAGRSEEDFIAYNRAFHEAITGLSGNRRMGDYSRNLGEQHDRLVRISISRSSPRDYDGFVREHGEIIDAIQARDGRRAARLVHKHIKNGERRIVAALSRAAIVP
jgi:DNA-binding GntR family transcriptional regulator